MHPRDSTSQQGSAAMRIRERLRLVMPINKLLPLRLKANERRHCGPGT